MIILGIDPSTVSSGFGVLEKDGRSVRLLAYGCLKVSSKKSLIERVGIFHDFFDEKINTHKIDRIAIETPFFGKSASTFGKLSYLRGIMYFLAYKYDIQLDEFTPTDVKAIVGGRGGASKEEVARMVRRLFPGLTGKVNNDITDALGVAYCALHNNRSVSELYKKRKQKFYCK
jgi:crossover junction endodeoxyribonuclease RuvC